MRDGGRKQVGVDWLDRLADERAQAVNDPEILREEIARLQAEVDRLQKIVRGVVSNVHTVSARRYDRDPLWALVHDVTALGSTSAKALCLEFGWDPDALVRTAKRLVAPSLL